MYIPIPWIGLCICVLFVYLFPQNVALLYFHMLDPGRQLCAKEAILRNESHVLLGDLSKQIATVQLWYSCGVNM